MPYHKLLRAHLHEDISDIERQGEVIVQVLNVPNTDYVDVYTRFTGQEFMDLATKAVSR